MTNIEFTIPSVLTKGSGEKKIPLDAIDLQDAFTKVTEQLGEDFKQQFDFENGEAEGQQLDKEKHEAIGLCPICQKGQVYDLAKAYACENAVASPKTCTFRISKMILQRDIPKEQVLKLIHEGKTDLLPKFISKKGRAFAASLKLDNGKIGFEFAPRAPKKKKTPAPKIAAAA